MRKNLGKFEKFEENDESGNPTYPGLVVRLATVLNLWL